MSQIVLDVSEMTRLKDALKRAPASVLKEVGTAVEKAAYKIQEIAIKEAPVNKGHGGGNLRQNIRIQSLSKTKAVIRSGAKYSLFVEEGTKPHLIRPRVKRALADTRNGLFFGTLVHHPGTRSNPYMRRAVERSTPFIIVYIKSAISSVFRSIL